MALSEVNPSLVSLNSNGGGVSEVDWLRGRAWALAVALMTFPYYWHTMPTRVNDRLAMARSV